MNVNISYEDNLDRHGWQTTLFTILFLTWGLRYFLKKGTSEKGCVEIEDWGTFVHFILGFQENSMQSLSVFYCFLLIKRILKALFFSFLDY